MEKLAWVVSAGEPVILIALLLGGGLPLFLLPGLSGQVVAGAAVAAILGFNYCVDRSISHLPVRLGRDAVLNREAVVVEPLDPDGMVRCEGEMWVAVEAHGRPVERGERVRVVEVRGLKLRVERLG